MEIVICEVQAIESAMAISIESEQRELRESELAMVGGGVGDISLG